VTPRAVGYAIDDGLITLAPAARAERREHGANTEARRQRALLIYKRAKLDLIEREVAEERVARCAAVQVAIGAVLSDLPLDLAGSAADSPVLAAAAPELAEALRDLLPEAKKILRG
jgi:hypothetical protein